MPLTVSNIPYFDRNRAAIKASMTPCPKYGEDFQIQLVWRLGLSGGWKCRKCKHVYETKAVLL